MPEKSPTTGQMLDDLNALDIPDLKDPKHYCDDNASALITTLSGFSIMLQTYLADVTPYTTNVAPNLRHNVVSCGIDLVRNVYTETELYTRNTLVACQITRHAMSLYFEFVSQITDGQFKHIQLSVRDTMLFVYKQTLFRLHDEKKASFVSTQVEREHHECLTHYTKLLMTVCSKYIDADDAIDEKQMTLLSVYAHSLDEHVSRLFAYDTDDSVMMMKSLCVVTECVIRQDVKQDYLFDVLTRLVTFFRHKVSRGVAPASVVRRVLENCKVLDISAHSTDSTDGVMMDLTRIL